MEDCVLLLIKGAFQWPISETAANFHIYITLITQYDDTVLHKVPITRLVLPMNSILYLVCFEKTIFKLIHCKGHTQGTNDDNFVLTMIHIYSNTQYHKLCIIISTVFKGGIINFQSLEMKTPNSF